MAAALLGACVGPPDDTSHATLVVAFPEALVLDRVHVEAEVLSDPPRPLSRASLPEVPRRLQPSGETLVLRLPEGGFGAPIRLTVVGALEDRPLARGDATVDMRRPGPHLVTLISMEDPTDAGVASDAGSASDAGPEDAGFADAGASLDAASTDGGADSDAGPEDVGPDAGAGDTSVPADAGAEDTGATPDAGFEDGGAPPDAGFEDSGVAPDAAVTPPPTALAFAATTGPLTWRACSSTPLRIELRDALGRPAVALTPTPIGLAPGDDHALTFYADASCQNATGGAIVLAGQSSVDRWVRAERVGATSARATSPGMSSATTAVPVPDCALGCGQCGGSGTCCRPSTCGNGQDCSPACGAGCLCQLDCGRANNCDASCSNGASCTIDCVNADNCEATCTQGAACAIECDGANTCDKARCVNGGTCLIYCGRASNCGFERCQGGRSSCPGNIIVCNRACP